LLTLRDFTSSLHRLRIDPDRPVIAHASLSAFGQVQGGARTVVGALLSSYRSVIMPAFTYATMVTPECGPPDNSIVYGSGRDTNRMAEYFTPDLPADRMMGIVAETLRQHPQARRSAHPILSFTGVNAEAALQSQTYNHPLQPIRVLADAGGWVLLLGVDHTCNTSIHYAERLAGRKQFVRWALTPEGVKECRGWPGCSDGFQAIAPRLEKITRMIRVGQGLILAILLLDLVEAVLQAISEEPLALLCNRPDCGRCNAVRQASQR
jgi:aminoglycoside 3-N-acetyltransferase